MKGRSAVQTALQIACNSLARKHQPNSLKASQFEVVCIVNDSCLCPKRPPGR